MHCRDCMHCFQQDFQQKPPAHHAAHIKHNIQRLAGAQRCYDGLLAICLRRSTCLCCIFVCCCTAMHYLLSSMQCSFDTCKYLSAPSGHACAPVRAVSATRGMPGWNSSICCSVCGVLLSIMWKTCKLPSAATAGLRQADMRCLAAAEAFGPLRAWRGCCSTILNTLLAVHGVMPKDLACYRGVRIDVYHQLCKRR